MKTLNKSQKIEFLKSILTVLEEEKRSLKAQKSKSVLHAEAYNFVKIDIYDTLKELKRLTS